MREYLRGDLIKSFCNVRVLPYRCIFLYITLWIQAVRTGRGWRGVYLFVLDEESFEWITGKRFVVKNIGKLAVEYLFVRV